VRSGLSNLTTRGRAFLSAGVTSAACAILLGQEDLLRVGLLLISLPIITALIARRSRYLLTSRREVLPARIQAGQAAQVSIHLENPGRVPTGFMLLEDHVPYILGSRPRYVLDQLRPKWHRTMSYTLRSEIRGRYLVGPLHVRITDPFGFVELGRAFTTRSALVVTPAVVSLPVGPLTGDWSGTGDNRPRAFASAGTEDVTVREYRLGDDLRRIHWRSTARADELMVRREEQPHQSRATLLLDTRAVAHRGTGPASSFEFAVSAAASIGAHLVEQGFLVRLLSDDTRRTEATWHDRGVSGAAEVELLLDSLAVVQNSHGNDLGRVSHEHNAAGLVVAVLGVVTPTDVTALSSLRSSASRSLALLLDVAGWTTSPGAQGFSVDEQAMLLRRSGWTVVVAGPGDRLPALWRHLTAARGDSREFGRGARVTSEGPAA
jgi:uncharacterized protein (DUF58 family)